MKDKLTICYEDNHLLVINKPSGMLSQGDRTGDGTARDVVMQFIKERDQKPGNVFAHPAHRLDRPVSGLLIMAKTSKGLSRMTQLFRNREVDKCYLAVCKANRDLIQFGQHHTIKGYISKDRKRNIVRHHETPYKDAKQAITKIERLRIADGLHILKCYPITGRPHQIRIQLASIGLPILGDKKYGRKEVEHPIFHLHSWSAGFIHPVKKERIDIVASFPHNGQWPMITKEML